MDECASSLNAWSNRRPDDTKRLLPRAILGQLASRYRALLYALSDIEARGLDLSSAKVLDVGSASGYGLTPFLAAGIESSQLHGVDLFPDRVALGQRKYPGIAFARQDATRLSFPTASFDIVCEQFCFCHIMSDDVRSGIAAEMLRVVKPGGFIIVLDWRVGRKKMEYNGVTKKKIAGLFRVGEATDVVRRYNAQLLPPVGRVMSRLTPAWYDAVMATLPALAGAKLTVLRRR